MNDTEAREALRRIVKERGESYAALSRMIGRNVAYLQQFATRGSPARLEERDRRMLARYLKVDEQVLGGPASGYPASSEMVQVSRLAVEASAGLGSMVDGEFAIGTFRFDQNWLRQVSRAKPHELSIISVTGDSMAPALNDGDDVLVDQSESGRRVRDGIYVLRLDETLMVKRLAMTPVSGTVSISSDNPAYPSWPDTPLASVAILGRVVWIGRKLV
jgi:phage repressor protein C with HTH and peptisase S24 domain